MLTMCYSDSFNKNATVEKPENISSFQTLTWEDVCRLGSGLSGVSLLHMDNAAGDSLLRVIHDNTGISGWLR